MKKSELMKRSNNISVPPAETGELRSGVERHKELELHNNRGSQSHSQNKLHQNCGNEQSESHPHNQRQYTHTWEQMVKNLTYLIHVYDAADSLYHFSHQLTGHTLSPHSIVSELLLVTDVINHMSTLYDPEIEWEENPVREVLDRKELSAVERAERLV